MDVRLFGDGSNTLRKPVEALVMVPRTHKLTPLARKMYTVFLYVTQQTLKQMGAIPPGNYLFEAPLVDVLRAAGAEGQNTMAKTYLAEMRKIEVSWDAPDVDYGPVHIGFNMISETRIVKREGMVILQWALPPTLLEVLADPKRWASINLLYLAQLKLYASIVLYEICSRYRNNPSHLTSRMPVEWWIELLTASPTVIDPATGKLKLIEWRKYKNKYLHAAIEEINEKSDLHIQLIEDKLGGKAIKEAQFFVKVKADARQAPQIEVKVEPISDQVLAMAKHSQISDLKELQALVEKYKEPAVSQALERLRERMSQGFSPEVGSPIGYLRHILRVMNPPTEELFEPQAPFPARSVLNESKPSAPISTLGSESRNLFDESNLAETWLANRQAEILDELKSMKPDEIQTWLTAYGETLRKKGLLTPTTRDRINSPTWFAAARVRLEMMQFYGLAKYGEAWNCPPSNL
ncbi:MAG: hypothetical protein ACK5BY_13360 [Limnohabitans sp.]|jgi:hypothetical protein|uniref:hypothetical protein n=1 Tax=Limnohabitans sp. TaxID=1907725 RepID=UPI00391AD223